MNRTLWSAVGPPYPDGRDTHRAALDLRDDGELTLTVSDADDTEVSLHLTRREATLLGASLLKHLVR